jgi:hypothetical protein
MTLEAKLIVIGANLLFIALPVAFLEIIIEKDKGWGAGHPTDSWYGRKIGENNPLMKFLCKTAGIPYVFGYGFWMYFILIPIILLAQYFFWHHNLALMFASSFAIGAVEDFLWFVFNWNFDSLRQLLKGPEGNIWWHKKWVKISSSKYLPRSYFIAFTLTAVLIYLA